MIKYLTILFILLIGATNVSSQTIPFGSGTASSPLIMSPANGTIFSTNAIQTCGPQSSVISSLNQSVTLNCPGASDYLINITTPSGQSPFVGSLTSTDSVTGGGRRYLKTGVGPLEVITEVLNGNQSSSLEYRVVGGGYGETITASAYTSGQALVTIIATYQPTTVFINGPVHNSEEAALRNGKAFTSSTGTQTIAVGNALSLLLTNPTNSGMRFVFPPYGRVVACNNVASGALLPSFVSIPNPNVNVPTTAITPSRRGGISGTSVAQVFYGNSSSIPAVTPAPTTTVGNPFFGVYPIAQDRTLEPGNSFLFYIVGVAIPTGLSSSNPSCSIVFSWYEESMN